MPQLALGKPSQRLAIASYVDTENGRTRSVEFRQVNLVTGSIVLAGSDPAADGWRIGGHPRSHDQPYRHIDRLGSQIFNDHIDGRTRSGSKLNTVRFEPYPVRPALFCRCVFDQTRQDLCQPLGTRLKIEQVLPRYRRIAAALGRFTVGSWQLPAVVAVQKNLGIDFQHATRHLDVVGGRYPVRKDDVAVTEPAVVQVSRIAHCQVTYAIKLEADARVKVGLAWQVVHL